MKMKIIYFGTPDFSATVLTSLIGMPDMDVVAVVTQSDRPVSRSRISEPSPVKRIALQYGIPVHTPEKIRKNPELLATLQTYNADYLVVFAYGKILPESLLALPRKRAINIHPSLLPRWRGPSPMVSALIAGDTETGICIMDMVAEMDAGDLLSVTPVRIGDGETGGTLTSRVADLSGDILVDTLRKLETDAIIPLPQDHTLATFSEKIEKSHGRLDYSKRAETLYHLWQGLTPMPWVFTYYQGKRLTINRASWQDREPSDSIAPWTVVCMRDGTIGITTVSGILVLHTVTLEGKKPTMIADFVRGYREFVGSVLG